MVVNAVSFLANTEVYAKSWRIYMKIATTNFVSKAHDERNARNT